MYKKITKQILIIILLLMTTQNVFAFSDISEKDWFNTDVKRLQRQDIINGYNDGTFRPNGNVTNGEALKLILTSAKTKLDKKISQREYDIDRLYYSLRTLVRK